MNTIGLNGSYRDVAKFSRFSQSVARRELRGGRITAEVRRYGDELYSVDYVAHVGGVVYQAHPSHFAGGTVDAVRALEAIIDEDGYNIDSVSGSWAVVRSVEDLFGVPVVRVEGK